jgi:hypothetical protein
METINLCFYKDNTKKNNGTELLSLKVNLIKQDTDVNIIHEKLIKMIDKYLALINKPNTEISTFRNDVYEKDKCTKTTNYTYIFNVDDNEYGPINFVCLIKQVNDNGYLTSYDINIYVEYIFEDFSGKFYGFINEFKNDVINYTEKHNYETIKSITYY